MEKDNKRMLIIYVFILFVFVVSSLILALFIIPNYFKEYARIASLLVWVGLFLVSIQFSTEHGMFKAKQEKIKTTLIIVIIYYTVYFLFGLLIGFRSNPYSLKFSILMQNIIFILGMSLLQEYIRAKLVNNYKKASAYIIITIIFIIINIDFQTFISVLSNNELTFRYVCGTVLPAIATSALCTYLAKIGGYQLIYAYIIPTKLNDIITPVQPDLDWFISTIFSFILIITLLFYNNYEHVIKTTRMTRRELKRENPNKILPTIILLILLVSFIAGILPYKPVAIMSNSMLPTFARGDVAIIQKINGKYENIKVGDIVEFRTEHGTIIHRVVKIEKDENGKFLFTTKGDMNLTNDAMVVNQENVQGIARFFVKYLGYPSVWFAENIFGQKAIIEI